MFEEAPGIGLCWAATQCSCFCFLLVVWILLLDVMVYIVTLL